MTFAKLFGAINHVLGTIHHVLRISFDSSNSNVENEVYDGNKVCIDDGTQESSERKCIASDDVVSQAECIQWAMEYCHTCQTGEREKI